MAEDVDLEKGMSCDDAASKTDWVAKATKRGYTLWLDENYHLWVSIAGANKVMIANVEICGFSAGVFIKTPVNNPTQRPDGIPWMITKDTEYVVLVGPDKSKTCMTVASLVYKAFKDHGIPQVNIECHSVEAKTALVDLGGERDGEQRRPPL